MVRDQGRGRHGVVGEERLRERSERWELWFGNANFLFRCSCFEAICNFGLGLFLERQAFLEDHFFRKYGLFTKVVFLGDKFG